MRATLKHPEQQQRPPSTPQRSASRTRESYHHTHQRIHCLSSPPPPKENTDGSNRAHKPPATGFVSQDPKHQAQPDLLNPTHGTRQESWARLDRCRRRAATSQCFRQNLSHAAPVGRGLGANLNLPAGVWGRTLTPARGASCSTHCRGVGVVSNFSPPQQQAPHHSTLNQLGAAQLSNACQTSPPQGAWALTPHHRGRQPDSAVVVPFRHAYLPNMCSTSIRQICR